MNNEDMTQATKQFFGAELGQHLIDKNLVVPMYYDKKTSGWVPCGTWTNPDGHYYTGKVFKAQTYAVICGRDSGLICLDIDDGEAIQTLFDECELPEPSYVNQKNGKIKAHYYFKYDESIMKKVQLFSNGNQCGDIQSNKSLAKFHVDGKSRGKAVISADLAPVHYCLRFYVQAPALPPSPQSANINKRVSIREYLSEATNKCLSISGYMNIENQSIGRWRLERNEEKIVEAQATAIRRLQPGNRGMQFWRIVFEAARYDYDTASLFEAGKSIVGEGFTYEKMEDQYFHAIEQAKDEYSAGLAGYVDFWLSIVRQVSKDKFGNYKELADYIAARAIYLNTYEPQINKKRLERRGYYGKNTTSSQAQTLERLGLIRVIKSKQPRNPDNFQLCIDGVPVYKASDELEELLKSDNFESTFQESKPGDIEMSTMDYDEALDPDIKNVVMERPEPSGPSIVRDLASLKTKISESRTALPIQSPSVAVAEPEILTMDAAIGFEEPARISTEHIECFKQHFADRVWINRSDITKFSMSKYRQAYTDMTTSKDIPNELKWISKNPAELLERMEKEIWQ